MATEGQVQYLLVLARLVPTRNLANQYLLSPQLMGMGTPTLARLPPVKAGHLNHDLIHLGPRHVPSFPPHLIVILRPTPGLKVPTRQAKLLPTRTRSLLHHIVLPTLALQPKVLR